MESFQKYDIKKRIMFEPDLDLESEQMLDIEDQMLNEVKNKLGEQYKITNWNLDIKCILHCVKKER